MATIDDTYAVNIIATVRDASNNIIATQNNQWSGLGYASLCYLESNYAHGFYEIAKQAPEFYEQQMKNPPPADASGALGGTYSVEVAATVTNSAGTDIATQVNNWYGLDYYDLCYVERHYALTMKRLSDNAPGFYQSSGSSVTQPNTSA